MIKSRYIASAVGAIAALCLASVSPAQAVTATAAAHAWALESTPANDGVTLTSVSCRLRRYCVAVGTFKFGSNGLERPAAYRWDGFKWTALPVPANAGDLEAIACTSIAYCMVVGDNSMSQAQTWTWDNRTWTARASDDGSAGILWAVRCAGKTSCEAVGEREMGFTEYPLAEHWDGNTWTNQSTAGAPAGTLTAVGCQYVGRCEAVGTNLSSNNVLAMRLSGSKWITEATPSLPGDGIGYSLTGVSCYVGGCIAVGNSEAGTTLAERWDHGTWRLLGAVGTGDAPGSNSSWNGIHCWTASNCTAVGGSANGNGSGFRTLVETWNGKLWILNTAPSPSRSGDQLLAITCPSTCTAVGYQGVKNLERSNSLAIRAATS
jgi:hypothetical protein